MGKSNWVMVPIQGAKPRLGILGDDAHFDTGAPEFDVLLLVTDLVAQGQPDLFADQIGLLALRGS